MITIETSDPSTDHTIISCLTGYVIEVNGVDIMVVGSGTDAEGWVTINGDLFDDDTGEGDPLQPRSFRLDGAHIVVY